MIHDIDTNDSTHKKWYNDRYRSSTLKSTLFSAHVHWSQTHFYKINLVFSEAEPACFIVRCLPPPLAYYDRRQRLCSQWRWFTEQSCNIGNNSPVRWGVILSHYQLVPWRGRRLTALPCWCTLWVWSLQSLFTVAGGRGKVWPVLACGELPSSCPLDTLRAAGGTSGASNSLSLIVL